MTTPGGMPKGLPIAPSLTPALATVRAPREERPVDARTLLLTGLAILVGIAGGIIARLLASLISLITGLAFEGRVVTHGLERPATAHLGALVILVPILGALVVGLMARFGSPAIRGHGIPEVMDRVLHGESRIPTRLLFLKPLSAAIAIGTGGPFGAEGPIIATGGALGSTLGQWLHATADERKTLLAAGAAAGMAATFGTPVAAVLLAVELLLFEYRPRSLVPVALAASAATATRLAFAGSAPVFPIPVPAQPSGAAMAAYVVLGALMGVAGVWITRAVYAVEDAFERIPLHWMWWPAIGAVAVGVIGWIEPRTLGVGYDNIIGILDGRLVGTALLALVVLKFVSWAVYLGSGTSGGTLAPLFTFGGGLGALAGGLVATALPGLGVDPRVAALVGMAAIFAGASHALLASVVFAFETTRQPMGLLPLLAGCSAAYAVSLLLMRHSIMTEKLARRGASVRHEYAVDHLSRVLVRDVATRDVVTLAADRTLASVREWLASAAAGSTHQAFPIVTAGGRLLGIVTQRDLLDPSRQDGAVGSLVRRAPAIAYEDSTLREAADHMVREGVGRLAVVTRDAPDRITGILSRSDLLAAHLPRLEAASRRQRRKRRARPKRRAG